MEKNRAITLYEALRRPDPYEPSPSIWTDEHIATEMLKAHLNAANDAASYAPGRRERICAFLWDALRLSSGKRLLDLGCGPGLYAEWFAQRGAETVGLDFSQNTIEYAREQARLAGLPIEYHIQDYRDPLLAGDFDAAIMVSEDYGVLGPADRKRLLQNIHRVLKPGGLFALDVTNASIWESLHGQGTWSREERGFWRPHPHAVLHKRHLYPEEHAYCDAYAVCDTEIIVYYTHQTLFTQERIGAEIAESGFTIAGMYGNLEGKCTEADDRQIGVIAEKGKAFA